ncbi:conjugal transfer protein TraW [Novosphingobium sp. ZW T3_23]|uniref:conjugal transfer protein TraW n=1 Tax=Novosphingobium sp. ZW T3_23 TaxID=3378084 RepID=UPI003852578F
MIAETRIRLGLCGLLRGTSIMAASAAMASAAGAAPSSTIGRTWPIAEPDALSEIEGKAAALPPNLGEAFGPRASWSAMKAAALPVAAASRIRNVVPFHTLGFDIALPGGKTLYPKGFTFNPLTYVKLPQRLVVVHPRDLAWALGTARPADFILLAAHGSDQSDPIELGEKAERPIFILEERVKARLGLTVAPVIVAQSGMHLVLREYGREALKAQKGTAR